MFSFLLLLILYRNENLYRYEPITVQGSKYLLFHKSIGVEEWKKVFAFIVSIAGMGDVDFNVIIQLLSAAERNYVRINCPASGNIKGSLT